MNHIKEVHVTQFSDRKAIVAALIAAHKAGQSIAIQGLTRRDDAVGIAQAIADEMGCGVGVISDKSDKVHIMVIDCEDFTNIDSEEPKP